MTKLRLLIDAHVFDGEFQGSRTFIQNLYLECIRQFANEIDFYFVAFDIERLKNIFPESDSVHFIPLSSKSKFRRLAIEFPLIISQNKIDWAHFQYIAPFIKTCKYIVTTHDILFERFPKYFPFSYRFSKHLLFKYSAKKADLLTTVSNYSKNEISHFYSIDQSLIHVISNGVKESLEEKNTPSKLNIEGPYILYISRIEPRKNHHLILKIFLEEKLFEKGYKLVFIGKESIKNPDLNSILSQNKKIDGLVRRESVSEEEKNALIKNASLFVYPSSAEGFGIPPLEAGLIGTPVVCSNLTAMADFTFFKTLHIDPSNEPELRNAILNALNNKIGYDLDETSNIIRSNYSWNKSAKKFGELVLNKKDND
jgi:glycosyltransferase involved in cell wall biosynthesis